MVRVNSYCLPWKDWSLSMAGLHPVVWARVKVLEQTLASASASASHLSKGLGQKPERVCACVCSHSGKSWGVGTGSTIRMWHWLLSSPAWKGTGDMQEDPTGSLGCFLPHPTLCLHHPRNSCAVRCCSCRGAWLKQLIILFSSGASGRWCQYGPSGLQFLGGLLGGMTAGVVGHAGFYRIVLQRQRC